MKKVMILLSVLIMTAACANAQQTEVQGGNMKSDKKILIAYYSRSGNTEVMAKQIQALTGGDLFEITTDHKYSEEYRPATVQAKEEIEKGFKPKLNKQVKNFESYDIVFVGSPCWWGTYAPAVASFLSDYDYSRKTIAPFMTHEGSGFGRTINEIKKAVPSAKLLEGKAVRGSGVNSAQKEIEKWLKDIKIIAGDK